MNSQVKPPAGPKKTLVVDSPAYLKLIMSHGPSASFSERLGLQGEILGGGGGLLTVG